MSCKTVPLDLYKANAALQLRLTRLLQENGHRWLHSLQQVSADGVAETSAEIEELLKSANWQTLATLPSESLRRLFQLRANDAGAMRQVALENQAAFVAGLQQALQAWQDEIAAAMRATATPKAATTDNAPAASAQTA